MITLNKKVTVLMPVYNGEKYVKSAIDSILNQTFKDFQLLVIDDGSTDSSIDIIKQYSDERLVFIQNEKNLGIVDTLNRGFSLIDSKYIARMDSDDIAYPTRLEEQVKYMDNNTNIAVSGTSVLVFNEKGLENKLYVKTSPRELRTELLFKSPLMHPTVILRNEVLMKYSLEYNKKYVATEDYGLWQNIAEKEDIGNLKEILLRYRDNELGISHNARKNVEERDQMHIFLHDEFLSSCLKLTLSDEELMFWRRFNTSRIDLMNVQEQNKLSDLIEKIGKKINDKSLSTKYFNNRVSLRFRMNARSSELTTKDTILLYKNKFQKVFKFNFIEMTKFIILNRKRVL